MKLSGDLALDRFRRYCSAGERKWRALGRKGRSFIKGNERLLYPRASEGRMRRVEAVERVWHEEDENEEREEERKSRMSRGVASNR